MRNIYPKLLLGLLSVLLFGGYLMAQNSDYKTYQSLVQRNVSRLGITKTDVETAVITNAYTDPTTQLTYVYLQQAYQQLKVYNTIITAVFRNDELLYTSGSFVKNIAAKAGSSIPTKTPVEATMVAARYLGLQPVAPFSMVADRFFTDKKYTVTTAGIAKQAIDVTLFWTPSDNREQITLTWNVNINVKDSADWWNVRVDAQTGAYVQKDNWTVSERLPVASKQNRIPAVAPLKNDPAQKPVAALQLLLQAPPPNVTSANYRVIPYPVESPNHGAFTTVNNPWLLAGATNNATSLGWHFDGTNNYTLTRGNNVFAYLDRANSNIPSVTTNWPDTSTTAAPSLNFINTFSTTQQPIVATNQKAALDNLFYWNNLMHDVTYQYGFNEVAGNFQQDNQSRGGTGGDYVLAEAQDAGGTNNANFSTPADGASGKMQMYLWSPATPTQVQVNSPETIAGNYTAVESDFSIANKLAATGPVTNQVVYYNDNITGSAHLACGVGTAPANSITGKIALIVRGTCTYTEKVKNAQNAGAIAVIMVNNVAGSPFIMGGTDNTITIPAVMISQANGNLLMTQLNANAVVNATLSSGVNLDGDLDNGIIVHEYGHGISTRLTGGPANSGCLYNAEQGGEGWSDYFALMMTTNWATATVSDGATARPVGTYAYGQPTTGGGLRRYPYTTTMSINPLTYASVAGNTEVHAIGEVWCTVLWDLTWALIQQQGITTNLYNSAGTGGNIIAMNLVMTGLKMQPCSPGFLDARDAILAADSALYGYAHKCLIWSAFARRGMGFSAVQGSPNNASDQTEAYDLPYNILISRPLVRTAGLNVSMTITHTATCNCQPVSGYAIQDTIPAGFTYVSSTPAGTLNGNVLSFPATSFTALETKTFSLVLRTPATGCTVDSVINDNREGQTASGLISSGSPGWSVSTAQAYSPASSWFAPAPATAMSSFLTSGASARTAGQNLSILSFWHNYITEGTYDGGVLEYSVDGGVNWNDATSLFYNFPPVITMDTSSVLRLRKAFSGGTPGFKQSILNLATLGTASVQFRFRMETDAGVGASGWYVDDIVRANGCGGILKTGTYNSAGIRQDTLMQPIFVTPQATLPVSLLWFYTNAVGSQVALDWKTLSEINAKDFTIEWSTNGTNWTTIGNTPALNRNANSYSLIHPNPGNGINYYRIRMNDADGKFSYSPVRTINMEGKNKPMVVLIPNPVNTDAVLYLSPEAKVRMVKVYDAAGSLVRQIAVTTGMQQVKMTTTNLAAGIYTVETNGVSRYTTRMLVQH